jgi:hypothetical protein
MSTDLFHNHVHGLYGRIIRETGPADPTPLRAIVRPSLHDHRILCFDAALHQTVLHINRRMGMDYMTLRFEGNRRWSMMGSQRPYWFEFEYVSVKHFKVTRLLCDPSAVICSFRKGGVDMERDIHNAFNILAQSPMSRNRVEEGS